MSGTSSEDNIHPKFASIIKQLYTIQENNVKCKVFINFGTSKEDISFRYENIDPVELDKLARSINKESNGINDE